MHPTRIFIWLNFYNQVILLLKYQKFLLIRIIELNLVQNNPFPNEKWFLMKYLTILITSVKYFLPSLAVNLSCLQNAINCGVLRFIVAQYILGEELKERAFIISTEHNHQLDVSSSHIERTGTLLKNLIEVLIILFSLTIFSIFIKRNNLRGIFFEIGLVCLVARFCKQFF